MEPRISRTPAAKGLVPAAAGLFIFKPEALVMFNNPACPMQIHRKLLWRGKHCGSQQLGPRLLSVDVQKRHEWEEHPSQELQDAGPDLSAGSEGQSSSTCLWWQGLNTPINMNRDIQALEGMDLNEMHLQSIFAINCPSAPGKREISFLNLLERQLSQDYSEM